MLVKDVDASQMKMQLNTSGKTREQEPVERIKSTRD